MYFKDVVTELVETIMQAANKNFGRCPECKAAKLKKSTLEHMIEVAVSKVASTEIGGSVPAPDYIYKCPNCKNRFILVEGKFICITKSKFLQ